jgi:hypothetical protein
MSSESVQEAKLILVQMAWKKGLETVAEAGGRPERGAKTLKPYVVERPGFKRSCSNQRPLHA